MVFKTIATTESLYVPTIYLVSPRRLTLIPTSDLYLHPIYDQSTFLPYTRTHNSRYNVHFLETHILASTSKGSTDEAKKPGASVGQLETAAGSGYTCLAAETAAW